MKRELKKQIKENEFQSGVEVAWKWYRENDKLARGILVALLLVLAVTGGLRYFQNRREHGASAAFDAALRIYETPLAAELQGPPPSGVTPFKEASEKFTKAAAAFDGVERGYPGQLAGRRARYYAALCRIEVVDNGTGIPEDVRLHMFEAFYTTKKSGTGLGLPIVKRLMTLQGGTVDVDSREGTGTVAALTLPLARG